MFITKNLRITNHSSVCPTLAAIVNKPQATPVVIQFDKSAKQISAHALMTDVLKACQILSGVAEAPNGWGVFNAADDKCLYRTPDITDAESWQLTHKQLCVMYIAEVNR